MKICNSIATRNNEYPSLGANLRKKFQIDYFGIEANV